LSDGDSAVTPVNIHSVSDVLLADGEWHSVADRSFEVVLYQYADGDAPDARVLLPQGEYGLCPAGFRFSEGPLRGIVSGPLTAVLAVRESQPVR
jgi:hypothetical protein